MTSYDLGLIWRKIGWKRWCQWPGMSTCSATVASTYSGEAWRRNDHRTVVVVSVSPLNSKQHIPVYTSIPLICQQRRFYRGYWATASGVTLVWKVGAKQNFWLGVPVLIKWRPSSHSKKCGVRTPPPKITPIATTPRIWACLQTAPTFHTLGL